MAMEIYISLISLSRMLSTGRLSVTDTPDYVSDQGFSGIEILDRQLAALDDDAFRKLCQNCVDRGCGVVVDAGCDLTISDPAIIQAEIDHLIAVIDQAALLGCNVIRIAVGGQRFSIQKLLRRPGSPDGPASGWKHAAMSTAQVRKAGYVLRALTSNLSRYDDSRFLNTAAGLDRVLPYALERGISLAIENHWGISSRPEWILRILETVDGTNIGTCPDFGNFPLWADRYAGLAMLAPRALHVQAKCWSFGSNGEERTIDFARCMAALEQSGYDRTISIEYEGGGDGIDACIKARELILRHR